MPFPHVEDNRRRPRPAPIVAMALGVESGLCWGLMITNAERSDWPGDVPIADHSAAGLPIPSKIRTEKIATLEAASANRIGHLPVAEMAQVERQLKRRLDPAGA